MKTKHTILGIAFTIVFGILSHFLYEFSGYNTLVGLISPINESIWEHLKLLFMPVILFSIIEFFARRNVKCFIPARTLALFIGMFFIVSTYYTISGIIGKNIDWFNIIIFLISVFIVFVLTEIIIKNCHTVSRRCIIGCIILLLMTFVLFIIWTFYPPELNIFIDNATNSRGIYRI